MTTAGEIRTEVATALGQLQMMGTAAFSGRH